MSRLNDEKAAIIKENAELKAKVAHLSRDISKFADSFERLSVQGKVQQEAWCSMVKSESVKESDENQKELRDCVREMRACLINTVRDLSAQVQPSQARRNTLTDIQRG